MTIKSQTIKFVLSYYLSREGDEKKSNRDTCYIVFIYFFSLLYTLTTNIYSDRMLCYFSNILGKYNISINVITKFWEFINYSNYKNNKINNNF